ncbi:MAG: response regulator transcription factor, partial [Bacteroidota bacterium]
STPIMFILPPFLRQFLSKRRKQRKARSFLSDEQIAVRVKKIAVRQQRDEQEVYDDILTLGMELMQDKDDLAAVWDELSPREQQVTALTCLGYPSYEIAGMLGISYETVRTHSKHIYAKFGLNRKELRRALKDWDFRGWLESSYPV